MLKVPIFGQGGSKIGTNEDEGMTEAEEGKPEVGKTDFEFYAKFAKPLILTLNCTEGKS